MTHEKARVIATDGLNLRSKPITGKNEIRGVPYGSVVTILSRPTVGEGKDADIVWYNVRTDAGDEGWMAASKNGVPYLEFLPTGSSGVATNLKPGDMATTVGGEGAPSHGPYYLHELPSATSRTKAIIEDSTVLWIRKRPNGHVDSYPAHDGRRAWWYVRTRTGNKAPYTINEGWMAEYEGTTTFLQELPSRVACDSGAGAPVYNSHLSKGQIAYVLTYKDETGDMQNLRVRNGPGTNYDLIGKLPSGTTVEIVNGPKCVDDSTYGPMVWWQVRRPGDRDVLGWVSEGNEREWLLAPLTRM